MDIALAEAEEAAKAGEVPVGAVIVRQGQILARAGNRVERDQDPTAHAEILAIRAAAHHMRNARLIECDLYVTLEPCPMCAAALSLARIRRIYYAAYDPKSGAIDHGPRLYNHAACHHKPETYGGIEEQRSAKLLKEFFAGLRNDQS